MSTTPSPQIDALLAHRDWVKRLAVRLTRDEHAAEDLAQDAWLAALTSPPERDGVRAWFRRVLRNRSHNVHRDDSRRAAREERAGPRPETRSTAAIVAEADAHRHVVDAVMDLEEPYRTTMVLRYFEELSVQGVADRCDVPLETARARLRRAREQLRNRLDGEFGSRSAWCVPLLAGWPGLRSELARTAGASTATATAAVVVGGLIVKQLIAAAVVALVIAGAWFAWPNDEPSDPLPENDLAVVDDTTESSDERRHVAVANGPQGDEVIVAPDAATVEDPLEKAKREARAAYEALPKRRVSGRVEDIEGRPIAGASVMVGSARRMWAEAGTVSTAADGAFTIDAVDIVDPPASRTWLWASADEHVARKAALPNGDEVVVITLPDAVRLRIRVLDASGSPREGVDVRVGDETNSGATFQGPLTDATGWTEVPGLPAGAIVSLSMPAGARINGRIRKHVTLPKSGTLDVDFRDDGTRTITVNATVSDPSMPITGLMIESSGSGQILAWPGGLTATFEVPGSTSTLQLSTPTGTGEPKQLGDTEIIDLHVDVPEVRWIEVEVDPEQSTFMSFAGVVDGTLALINDLRRFKSEGTLRLPLVPGAEYGLRRPDGTGVLLSEHSPSRLARDEEPPRVDVKIVSTATGSLPPDATVTASPTSRGTRLITGHTVTSERSPNGTTTLELQPGITYGIEVSAPDHKTTHVEYRVKPSGNEIDVQFVAGGPFRAKLPGVNDGARVSVIGFPGFTRLSAEVESGHVVVEGAGDGWLMIMGGTGVFLMQPSADGSALEVPTFDVLTITAAGEASESRTFLIGAEPIADGIHAVALVGAPFGVPAGTYIPVEWSREEFTVYPPATFDEGDTTWTRPDRDALEWTTGDADSGTLWVTVGGHRIPIGALGGERPTKWRTAELPVTLE